MLKLNGPVVGKDRKAALGIWQPRTSLPSLPYLHDLCPAHESPSGDVPSSPTQLFSPAVLSDNTDWLAICVFQVLQ